MPANDEQPVVKLPQSLGSPEPVPLDYDPPPDEVVQLPKVFPADSELTPTESNASEYPQFSPAGPSIDEIANPPYSAGQPRNVV